MGTSVAGFASRALARASQWTHRLYKSPEQGLNQIGQCPSKLNFGCGYDKREGYLNVDVDPTCTPDLLIVDGDDSSIPRRHFSEVLAKDVLENIPRPQTLATLLNFADYLVLGGKLIIQTSSILHVAAKLQKLKRFADHDSWTICLFGNQAHPKDFHHTGFTEVTLRTYLIAAGFTIEALELRDEWLFYVEAKKTYDWTSIIDSSRALSDPEFLQHAYQAAFYRDVDEIGIQNFGKMLTEGAPRKQVLKQIFSAPERLHRTADLIEPIDLSKSKIHDSATAKFDEHDDSLSFATPRRRWSYALSMVCPLITTPSCVPSYIEIDSQIENGMVGFGLNDPELKKHLSEETIVRAEDGRKVIRIPVAGLKSRETVLVIRNVGENGEARGAIHRVAVLAATDGRT